MKAVQEVTIHIRAVDGKHQEQLTTALLSKFGEIGHGPVATGILIHDITEEEDRWVVQLQPTDTTAPATLEYDGQAFRLQILMGRTAPLVTGRDNTPTASVDICLRISTATASDVILAATVAPTRMDNLKRRQTHARHAIKRWLQWVYEKHMQVDKHIVKVYELVQEWGKEYVPSWRIAREENSVSQDSRGFMHYTTQEWSRKAKSQAELVVKYKLLNKITLFVHGAKGSGKTLFAEWLAGELEVPILHVNLHSAALTDDILRDALSRARLPCAMPAIVHFDEFQTLLSAWEKRHGEDEGPAGQAPTITLPGLQNIVEGGTTPRQVVFLFTSSKPFPQVSSSAGCSRQHELAGLRRRFLPHHRHTIPPISGATAVQYLVGVLRPFVSETFVEKYMTSSFLHDFHVAWDWSSARVPFDALSKFVEKEVGSAIADGTFLTISDPSRKGFRCPTQNEETFAHRLLRAAHIRKWLAEYLGEQLGDAVDGSSKTLAAGFTDVGPACSAPAPCMTWSSATGQLPHPVPSEGATRRCAAVKTEGSAADILRRVRLMILRLCAPS